MGIPKISSARREFNPSQLAKLIMAAGPVLIGAAAVRGSTIVVGTPSTPQVLQLPLNTGAYTETAVTVNSGSTLDITNNKVVISYGQPGADPVSAIAAELSSGYNGGTWAGVGIDSSTAAVDPSKYAVGYLDGDRPSDAIDKTVAANQMDVRYTLNGDAFLEGSVGFDDLVIVAMLFGMTGRDWASGNFTYDPNGSVGFADLVAVSQNFGAKLGISQGGGGGGLSAAWEAGTSVVPEPGSAALVVMGAGLLARRRRRLSGV